MPNFAALASVVALIISVASFGFSLLTHYEQRQRDRRDMFVKMHEALIAPDLQRGRRLLNSETRTPSDFRNMQTHSPDDYQAINRCLAMFDIFAMYVDQKFVDEKLVLKEWGHTFAYTWQHAEPCIEARNEREHYRSWANLREFGPRTVEWADANPRT